MPGRANRITALIRAVLRKAEREWGWIDKAPAIRRLKEDNKRIRWITHQEAERLCRELPELEKSIEIFPVFNKKASEVCQWLTIIFLFLMQTLSFLAGKTTLYSGKN
ncbi:MAG: hypothetical protein ACXWAB_11015 [Methylobacter sp.]